MMFAKAIQNVKTRTLSRDLAFGLVLVVTLIILLIGVVFTYFNVTRLEHELVQQAGDVSIRLANILSVPIWTLDRNAVGKIAEAYQLAENVAAVRVLDHRGVILYEHITTEADLISAEEPIYYGNESIGLVQVSISTRSIGILQRNIFLMTATTIFLVVTTVLGATWFLLQKFLERPMAGLVQGIESIAGGNYSYRLAPAPQVELNEIVQRVNAMGAQIGERMDALQRSEERFRQVVTSISDHVFMFEITENGDWVNRYASPRLEKMIGYPTEQFLSDWNFWITTIVHPEDAHKVEAQVARLTGGENSETEYRLIRADGGTIWVRDSARVKLVGSSRFIYGVISDITERKLAEESVEKWASFVRLNPSPELRVNDKGEIILANPASRKILHYEAIEGVLVTDILPGISMERILAAIQNNTITTHEARLGDQNYVFSICGVRDLGIANIYGSNITERKLAEEQNQRQLKRMYALHEIDQIINASLDLNFSLNTFLEQAVQQLGVDAADILLYDSHSQTLDFAAGRGFRTMALQHTLLKLNKGHAGKVAMEMRMLVIPELAEDQGLFHLSPSLADEGFVSYIGVPLIVKGQVRGVLEVFHRSKLRPDREWLHFLETLAGQAAIAIDNATLFEDLQKSNFELTLAYATTLEGWARALELRDKETQGHSRNVTDMTLKLAKALGMQDTQLEHVRRGALLHDIGKMGIPDNILLKPGRLTEEEWEVMRQHPVFAVDMLAPIEFLRPALDIPHFHHEKWDGTGYPYGLKGEAIPLAARIFSIVDVWDALKSERPYREAWPEEKVIAYIRQEAGKHFDPRVVDVFLHQVIGDPYVQ